jgi:hypothetical protein
MIGSIPLWVLSQALDAADLQPCPFSGEARQLAPKVCVVQPQKLVTFVQILSQADD